MGNLKSFVVRPAEDRKTVSEPHVSQERSSCFRLFLNFCVSRRSCRLLWLAPPFVLLLLAFTGEGTGGLIAPDVLAACSSAHNLWTCAGAEDSNISRLKPCRLLGMEIICRWIVQNVGPHTFCWCLRSFVIWAPFSSILAIKLSNSLWRSGFCLQCWVDSIWWTNSWCSLTNSTHKHRLLKSGKKRGRGLKSSLLTSSFVPARPAELRAAQKVSPVDAPLVLDPRQSLEMLWKMKQSPFGDFSWPHNQTCAVCSLVHTVVADGASSCGEYFVRWRGPNGLGLSTVTERKFNGIIKNKRRES